jgi:hypothetical protein
MSGGESRVAIYWDFENVHASVLDDIEGDGAYRHKAWRPQDAIVEIDPVVDFAAGFGPVVINRAYANWQWLGKYRSALQGQAIDLVQMFPLSGSKNGADIRLALDVIEDLHQHEHITHVVVVSGDSDFVSLAQRCRKLGRQFIAVGMPKTNALFKAACDEFKYYAAIVNTLTKTQAAADNAHPVQDLDQAADLFGRALRRLAVGADEPWVLKAAVRPMLVRLDPTFDEANYGYPNLNALISALDAHVAMRVGAYDRELAPRSSLDDTTGAHTAAQEDPVDRVDRALRRVQLRLPTDRSLLWHSIPAVIEVFTAYDDGIAPSFVQFEADLLGRLQAAVPTADAQDVKLLKNAHFKVGSFELLGERGDDLGIRLRSQDESELADRVIGGLLNRIGDQAPALLEDEETLVAGLGGSAIPADWRHRLGELRSLRASGDAWPPAGPEPSPPTD